MEGSLAAAGQTVEVGRGGIDLDDGSFLDLSLAAFRLAEFSQEVSLFDGCFHVVWMSGRRCELDRLGQGGGKGKKDVERG